MGTGAASVMTAVWPSCNELPPPCGGFSIFKIAQYYKTAHNIL